MLCIESFRGICNEYVWYYIYVCHINGCSHSWSAICNEVRSDIIHAFLSYFYTHKLLIFLLAVCCLMCTLCTVCAAICTSSFLSIHASYACRIVTYINCTNKNVKGSSDIVNNIHHKWWRKNEKKNIIFCFSVIRFIMWKKGWGK